MTHDRGRPCRAHLFFAFTFWTPPAIGHIDGRGISFQRGVLCSRLRPLSESRRSLVHTMLCKSDALFSRLPCPHGVTGAPHEYALLSARLFWQTPLVRQTPSHLADSLRLAKIKRSEQSNEAERSRTQERLPCLPAALGCRQRERASCSCTPADEREHTRLREILREMRK